MGDMIDIAAVMLSRAERRAEISAQNISNMATPGYKRRVSFASVMTASQKDIATTSATDFSAGKEMETGNPYDLAITGAGFFTLRAADGVVYSRQGQFRRDANGRIVDALGHSLQTQDGGDLVVRGEDFEVLSDGVVLADGEPVGQLAIADFADRAKAPAGEGGLYRAGDGVMTRVEHPAVRQRALEASNVSTGEEMVAVMESLRHAEAAQRLVGVYDDLMGRALNAFGQQ